VRAVDTDPTRMHLLRALVEFADRTGVQLIAEGIETAGELREIIDAGVPLGQGFLLGRPAPRPGPLAGEVRSMLKQQRASALASDGPRRTAEPGKALLELVESLRTAKERAMDHLLACASALLDAERVSVHCVPAAPAQSPDGEATLEATRIARIVELGAPLRLDRLAGTCGAFLGVPLLDESGPIGVLAVSSAGLPAFSVADERWLQIVAGIAAPYVRAARDSWRHARQAPSEPVRSSLPANLSAVHERRIVDALLT
jgi:GAF domain-containing protein